MSSPTEVRQTITDIIAKLENVSPKDEKQRIKSLQEVSSKLVTALDGDSKPIEKLYFGYLIVDFFSRPEVTQRLRSNLMLSIFPTMLNKRQAALASQIISLALTLRHGPLLDCLEPYLRNCDSITFPTTVPLDASLAAHSPLFCSAVISRGYFAAGQTTAGKHHLTEWLRTLVDCSKAEFTINLNKAIRFAFLDHPTDYELHLVLLSVIAAKRCEQLPNQFLIDLATSVANNQTEDNKVLEDRFAQMLIVAYAHEMCSQSNQLKSILLNKFPDNVLMRAVCK